MQNLSKTQLQQRYQELRQQRSANQISQEQYLQALEPLIAQDDAGTYWRIKPQNGELLQYDGKQWISAATQAEELVAQAILEHTPKKARALIPFFGFLLSSSCLTLSKPSFFF